MATADAAEDAAADAAADTNISKVKWFSGSLSLCEHKLNGEETESVLDFFKLQFFKICLQNSSSLNQKENRNTILLVLEDCRVRGPPLVVLCPVRIFFYLLLF